MKMNDRASLSVILVLIAERFLMGCVCSLLYVFIYGACGINLTFCIITLVALYLKPGGGGGPSRPLSITYLFLRGERKFMCTTVYLPSIHFILSSPLPNNMLESQLLERESV